MPHVSGAKTCSFQKSLFVGKSSCFTFHPPRMVENGRVTLALILGKLMSQGRIPRYSWGRPLPEGAQLFFFTGGSWQHSNPRTSKGLLKTSTSMGSAVNVTFRVAWPTNLPLYFAQTMEACDAGDAHEVLLDLYKRSSHLSNHSSAWSRRLGFGSRNNRGLKLFVCFFELIVLETLLGNVSKWHVDSILSTTSTTTNHRHQVKKWYPTFCFSGMLLPGALDSLRRFVPCSQAHHLISIWEVVLLFPNTS